MIGSDYKNPKDTFIPEDTLKDFPMLSLMNVLLGFDIETHELYPEWFLIGDSEQLLQDTRHEYALHVFRMWF